MNTLTVAAARAKASSEPTQEEIIRRAYTALIREAPPHRVFFFSSELANCLPMPKRLAMQFIREGRPGLKVRVVQPGGMVFLSFLPD